MRISAFPRDANRVAVHTGRVLTSPPYALLTLCALLYLCAAVYLRSAASRDPGSAFFDLEHAYSPIYSELRRQQADAFVASSLSSSLPSAGEAEHEIVKNGGNATTRLCVGLPSVARKDVRYLRSAIGALLEGLTAEERREIYLIAFIAQTDPQIHPAFREPWLHELPDEVLTYDALSQTERDHLAKLEKDQEGWREKELYDYKFILNACYEHTDAPYMAVFEDDTLALDGWYHRTKQALHDAATKTAMERQKPDDFLYLRLFYTEEFLGFNSEDWQYHTFWSLVVIAATYIILSIVQAVLPAHMAVYLTNRSKLVVCTIFVPLSIILFFITGKVTILPLPSGVSEMRQYGCCAQGLVFPRRAIPGLMKWYDQSRLGFVDTLMEQYADVDDELRWALTPPVIQHVGAKSSKIDTTDLTSKDHLKVAERLWNFGFELNDPAVLRKEHAEVAATKSSANQVRDSGPAG